MASSSPEVGLPARCTLQKAALSAVGITADMCEKGESNTVPQSCTHHAAQFPSCLWIHGNIHVDWHPDKLWNLAGLSCSHCLRSATCLVCFRACQDATELATAATEEAFIATQCGPAVPLLGLTVVLHVSLLRMLSYMSHCSACSLLGRSSEAGIPCKFKCKFRSFWACGSTSHAPSCTSEVISKRLAPAQPAQK